MIAQLLFQILQFIAISLFDLWQMAKKELLYWEAIMDTLPFLPPDVEEDTLILKNTASENISVGQFIFWFAEVALMLIFWSGYTFVSLVMFLCTVFLFYAGVEDLMFFLFSRWIKLPESWWRSREVIHILGFRLPKYMPWLPRTRQIGKLKIPSYWMKFFGGEVGDTVELYKGGIIAWILVIAIISLV
jgi:hypothetical protein